MQILGSLMWLVPSYSQLYRLSHGHTAFCDEHDDEHDNHKGSVYHLLVSILPKI